MFTVHLLEQTAEGSFWVPILVLGWFLIMTIVGWQVSRRQGPAGNESQAVDPYHTGSNPSEFDDH